jgi:hypothetical protein
VKRQGFRSAHDPLEEASGRGPTLLLLGGVGLGIVGVLVFSYGMLGAFSQMDRAGGPTGVFLVMQWIGFVSSLSGGAMVALSVAWWIWRIVRR